MLHPITANAWRRILNALQEQDGLTLTELARAAGYKQQSAALRPHILNLSVNGYVRTERDGKCVRVYLTDRVPNLEAQAIAPRLQRELQHGPLPVSELILRLRPISHATVYARLSELHRKGVVKRLPGWYPARWALAQGGPA